MLTDKHDPIPDCDCQACALAERDKLRAEVAELDALRDRLADLLTRTAVALRGPQPAMGRHSWHDLPERAAAAIAAIALVQVAERDRCVFLMNEVLAQVENLDEDNPQPDLSCIDWLRTAIAKVVGPNTHSPTAQSD